MDDENADERGGPATRGDSEEETLRQVEHNLKNVLETMHAKNLELDEENATLKKHVTDVKEEIGAALEAMRDLKEDLLKTRETLGALGQPARIKIDAAEMTA